MQFSRIHAFIAAVGLVSSAPLLGETRRQLAPGSSPPSGQTNDTAIGDIEHDLERVKVDLYLVGSAVASYSGPLNLVAASRILDTLGDLIASLQQSTRDAYDYESTSHPAAERESDSALAVNAVQMVAPIAHSTVQTLIASRDQLESGPVDAFVGNTITIDRLRQVRDTTRNLKDALDDAVSADQVAALDRAFAPIIADLSQAYDFYSGGDS